MCVGFTHGFRDFRNPDSAKSALTEGSAVSWDRGYGFHFAIYLGKLNDGTRVVGHWYKSLDEENATIRIDDFNDVWEGSKIRVYKCTCSAAERARVIWALIGRLGEQGYDVMGNNCETLVRQLIDNVNISTQTFWTLFPLTMPFQVLRLAVGGAIRGSVASSSSAHRTLKSLRNKYLIDPEGDKIELDLWTKD